MLHSLQNTNNANYIISFDAGSNTTGTALKVSADSAYFQSYVDIVMTPIVKMTMTGDRGSNNNIQSYGFWNRRATNLTAENYVGIADAAYSMETPLLARLSARLTMLNHLLPRTAYYVQNNGSLSTSAGSPSVVGGVAIASTKLLITRS